MKKTIDTENIMIGLTETNECLCITQACCISANRKSLGVGLVTAEGEICKLGLFCCNMPQLSNRGRGRPSKVSNEPAKSSGSLKPTVLNCGKLLRNLGPIV